MMAVYESRDNTQNPEAKPVASLRNTNLLSLATIIISLILLLLFFLMPQASF